MKPKPLIPADPKQCQALKRRANAFTLGSTPEDRELKRCTNKPTVIAYENAPAEDGQKGSMSLCPECLAVLEKQAPEGYMTVKPI